MMELILLIGFLIVVIAALLYINSKWQDAKYARDIFMLDEQYAWLVKDRKKISAIPFLFKKNI